VLVRYSEDKQASVAFDSLTAQLSEYDSFAALLGGLAKWTKLSNS